MKKNKPTDRKRTFAICGLSALCVAVLAGAWLLTREPEREFIPASTEASGGTDTWEENPGTDTSLPDAAAKETGSTTSLSDSSTKKDALQEKPSEPPVTTDDLTDPGRQPEYAPPVQQTPAPPQENPTGGSGDAADGGHPGQVYNPVFGWVTPSSVQQDSIDSDGDINKQIGTMGGN